MSDEKRDGAAATPGAEEKKPYSWIKLLKNPWVNLLAMTAGVLIGLYWEPMAKVLVPVAQLYLSLLKMCVIPIIATAITVSIGKMLKAGVMKWYLRRLLLVFACSVLMASAIGVVGAMYVEPGASLGTSSRAYLGQMFMQSEAPAASGESTGVWALLDSLIPANVFTAFSTGQMLAILFVSLFVGTALGVMKSESSDHVLQTFAGIYEAFLKILDWVLYTLPFGLMCLLAEQIVTLGTDLLAALATVFVLFYAGSAILCILYFIALRISTGKPFLQIISAFKDPLVIAFVARSSVAAIPVAMEAMEERLGQRRDLISFVVPLGVVMNRQSYPMLFALTTVFIAQLYQQPIGLGDCLVIVIGAAVAGMSAVGAPAVIAPMVGYVMGPVGLPVAVGISVLIAIGPVIDPMASMTNLFGSCTAAALIGNARHGKTQGTLVLRKDAQAHATA